MRRGQLLLFLAVGLVAAVVSALWAAAETGSTYRAERQVLFLSPPTISSSGVNPFLSFSPSINTSVYVMAIALSDELTQDSLTPPGSGTRYTAEPSSGLGGGQSASSSVAPILVIEAFGPDLATSEDLVGRVTKAALASLQVQQEDAKAPEETWITGSVVSSSSSRVWTTQVRNALAVGFLCVGAVALIIALDLRRSRSTPGNGSGEER